MAEKNSGGGAKESERPQTEGMGRLLLLFLVSVLGRLSAGFVPQRDHFFEF